MVCKITSIELPKRGVHAASTPELKARLFPSSIATDLRSVKRRERRAPAAAGFVLAEAMVAVGVAGILLVALCAFTMFTSRSFAALFNYVDLDDANRIAMDQLSRDIRQSNRVTDFGSTWLVLENTDSSGNTNWINYTYNSVARNLKRTQNGYPKVVLNNCDALKFDVCQRNPIGGSYDVYPAGTIATAKVIDVSWVCSRTLFGRKENTESVQTARIVIRKQGT